MDLILLLTEACDLCGRAFADGEEIFLLKRLKYHAPQGEVPGWCEEVNEQAFCEHECNGVEVVRL